MHVFVMLTVVRDASSRCNRLSGRSKNWLKWVKMVFQIINFLEENGNKVACYKINQLIRKNTIEHSFASLIVVTTVSALWLLQAFRCTQAESMHQHFGHFLLRDERTKFEFGCGEAPTKKKIRASPIVWASTSSKLMNLNEKRVQQLALNIVQW
jgi:hypothetical protein